MAIVWGPYQNHVRLGLQISQSPAQLSAAVYEVDVTYELYAQTDGTQSVRAESTASFTGAWVGSVPVEIRLGRGEVGLLLRQTRSFPTRLTAYSLPFHAEVSHPLGTSSVSQSWPIAARPPVPPGLPNPPSGLTVARVSDARHTLTWSRNSTYTSVIVQRRTSGGPWKQVGRATGNAWTWVDTTTKANQKYEYRVAGVHAGGTSPHSLPSAMVYTTPVAPIGVSAKRSGASITVQYSAESFSLLVLPTHFDIEDNGVIVAAEVPRASMPYVQETPTPTTHTYRIRARIASGTSNASTLVGPWSEYSTTVQALAAPNAPTSLSPNGVAVALNASVQLSWLHNPVDASDQTQRQLRWRVQGSPTWTELAAVAATAESAVIVPGTVFAGVTGVVEWAVRTRGVYAAFGPWSASATLDVINAPEVTIVSPEGSFGRPTLPVTWAWFQGEGRVQTSWEAQLLDASSAVIATEAAAGNGTTWTPAVRLESGSTYTVRVRAATATAWSAWAATTFTVAFLAPLTPLIFGNWDEDSGSVTVSIGRGENDPAPDVTNHMTNPSFATPSGAQIEVRRNLIFDPGCEDTTLRFGPANPADTGYTIVRDTSRASAGASSIRATHAASGVAPLFGTGYEARAGKTISASVDVFYTGALLLLGKLVFTERTSTGAYVGKVDGSARIRDVTPGKWTRLTNVATPSDPANHLVPTFPTSSTLFWVDNWLMEDAAEPGTYFEGNSNPLDPDLTASWTGVANRSVSVLTGKAVSGVTGVNCLAIQSSRFGGSLRLIPTSTTSSDSYAYLTLPTAVRADGTAVGRLQLDAPLTGSLSARARCLVVESPAVVGSQPANSAGGGVSRARYSGITTTNRVRLYHGGRRDSGDVFWTGIGAMVGEYAGDWFDGDSPMVNTGTGWKRGVWDGVPHASTSTAKTIPIVIESMDVLRSVDGGLTWETFVTGANPDSNFVDWESLSNGDTLYRAIAYAEITGASSYTDITIQATSPALWLSGGEQFALAARLIYDAKVKIAASRDRSSQKYEGRSRPVAYAGEHVQRSVDASGVLLENDEGNATVAELVHIAQAEAPLHMHRDPDGRRVYGILSDISLPRDSGTAEGGIWQWSYSIEESDH